MKNNFLHPQENENLGNEHHRCDLLNLFKIQFRPKYL